MKKLKIGLFIDTFYPMVDGVIQVVDQYATRLNKFCDVTVFTTMPRKGQQDTKQYDYKVVRCKVMAVPGQDYDLALPGRDKAFKKALNDAKLDIVHIHSPFSIGKCGVKYAKKHNIPAVATMHSQYKQDFYKATKSKILTNIMVKIIMKVFNECTECWGVNKATSQVFYEYGAKTMPGIQQNGTDIVPYTKLDAVEKLREKYGIKPDEKVFLYVGRIAELKNIFFTTEALKILAEKQYKFKMIFVGDGVDFKKLCKMIKDYNLENNVILTGKVFDREEITKFYCLADLFLFPSAYDTNGLVQIEAAAQKTPTIFLKDTFAASTITPEVNGYLTENDPKSFAEKIISIFDDKQHYAEVCENANKDIYMHWDTVISKVYNDYQKIIKDYYEKK